MIKGLIPDRVEFNEGCTNNQEGYGYSFGKIRSGGQDVVFCTTKSKRTNVTRSSVLHMLLQVLLTVHPRLDSV
jgi:hypothetical protein